VASLREKFDRNARRNAEKTISERRSKYKKRSSSLEPADPDKNMSNRSRRSSLSSYFSESNRFNSTVRSTSLSPTPPSPSSPRKEGHMTPGRARSDVVTSPLEEESLSTGGTIEPHVAVREHRSSTNEFLQTYKPDSENKVSHFSSTASPCVIQVRSTLL
jgi:hypothetical protein